MSGYNYVNDSDSRHIEKIATRDRKLMLVMSDHQLDEHQKSFLRIIESFSRNLAAKESSYRGFSFTHIKSFVFHSNEINVSVVKNGDSYYIGCTELFVSLLKRSFFRIASMTKIMPGLTGEEFVASAPLGLIPPNRSDGYDSDIPENRVRQYLALMMSEIAIRFSVAHEIGHILHQRARASATFYLDEIASAASGIDLDRHADEIQADTFAATWIAENVNKKLMRMDTLESEMGRKISEKEYCELYIHSIYILFSLFSIESKSGHSISSHSKSHPSPISRLLAIMKTVLLPEVHLSDINRSLMREVILSAQDNVAPFLRIMDVKDPVYTEADIEMFHNHLNDIYRLIESRASSENG